MDQLPLEVVFLIFSKSTLRTLLQCRRVCKSWRVALSDPETVKSSVNLPKCLVIHANPTDSFSSRFLYFFDHRTVPSTDNALLKLSLKVTDHDSVITELVGSCNGLLCWSRKEPAGEPNLFWLTIYISNPLTGESMTIPAGKNYLRDVVGYPYHYKSDKQFRIGFGYIPNRKQHKLVYLADKKRTDKYEVKMLTLGNGGTWKCLECPYYSVHPKFGVYANGALHWIVNKIDVDYYTTGTICSFDLETEQFTLLTSPMTHPYYFCGITVIKDWLTGWNKHCETLWMMTEYGIKSSWFELKTKGFDRDPYNMKRSYERPLIIYPMKKILVLRTQYHCRELYVYDHNLTHPMIDLQFPNVREAISGFEPTFLSIENVFKGCSI